MPCHKIINENWLEFVLSQVCTKKKKKKSKEFYVDPIWNAHESRKLKLFSFIQIESIWIENVLNA